MSFSHPYSKYGLALVMSEENLSNVDEITPSMLSRQIANGLGHFRMFTNSDPAIDDELLFEYMPKQFIIDNKQKGDPSKGVFLCPNIVTTDFSAKDAWNSSIGFAEILNGLKTKEELGTKTESLTMGLAPMAGKFNNGKKGQNYPKASLLEVACCAIVTTTEHKPCMLSGLVPTCIIPDIDVEKLKEFIFLFKLMQRETGDLMKVKVYRPKPEMEESKNKPKAKQAAEPKKIKISRPPIINGNYPFAPRGSAFGSMGLLAAIGRWSKEAGYSEKGKEILESLANVPIYIISYGDAYSVSFSHYIVNLAKDTELDKIIIGLENTDIHSEEHRTYRNFGRFYDNTKYQLFDMFSSRFLQQFSEPAFKDFLSIRAEYPPQLNLLFTTYFEKTMSIDKEIVQSACELGRWLNQVAYFIAREDVINRKEFAGIDKILKGEKNTQTSGIIAEYYVAMRKVKAKVLIQLESSALASKTSDALIMQMLTSAGRLSGGMDAPPEAGLFIKAVLSDEIGLDKARNFIIAYSRLRNRIEKPDSRPDSVEGAILNPVDINPDAQV